MKKMLCKILMTCLMLSICFVSPKAYGIEQKTDGAGIAIFSNLQEGNYTITVSKQGYAQGTATADIVYIDGLENAIVTIDLAVKRATGGGSINRPLAPGSSSDNTNAGDDESNPNNKNNPFTHDDYISKFEEYLALTPDDIHTPATRVEVANVFAEMFDIEHKNSGLVFYDVDKNEWYHPHVDDISRKEIMIGYSDGTFRPLHNITRAEIATVIVRTMGFGEDSEIIFSDIDNTHWAIGYIGKIVASGVMIGDIGRTFRPDESITRAELVIIINRLIGLNTKDLF